MNSNREKEWIENTFYAVKTFKASLSQVKMWNNSIFVSVKTYI